jgi:hypothetical protein
VSDASGGPGWWLASDGKWYAPELKPSAPAPSADETLIAHVEPDSLPTLPGETEQRSGSTRRLPIVLVALVVVAGVALLLRSVLGSDSATGAESPEAALDGLIQAIQDEDAIGIASMLDPDEFGLLVDSLDDADTSPGLPGGLDLTVTAPGGGPVTATFSTLGDSDSGLSVAAVDGVELALERTDGAATAVAIWDDRNVQAFSTAEVDPLSVVRLELSPTGGGFDVVGTGRVNGESLDRFDERVEDVPLELVFIESNGRWYLSLSYTIANLAVSAGAVDEPDYGAWRRVLEDETSGADTPIGVLERLFDAAPTFDIDDAILAIDPIETRLLHDFFPVIRAEIDDELAQAREEGELEITGFELTEEIDGDTANVYLDFVSIRAVDEFGDETLAELDGSWCYRVEDPFETVSGCIEDDIADAQRDLDRQLEGTGISFELRDLLPDRPLVVTTRRDGNWYLSPVATLYAYGQSVIDLALDVAEQTQSQLSSDDSGAGLAQQLVVGESTDVEVATDASVPLAITPDRDLYLDLFDFGPDIAFVVVTLTSDIAVDVQHTVDSPFDDSVRSTLRLRPDEPVVLVATSEVDFPRTQALLLRNGSADSATVTIDVQSMTVKELERGSSLDGTLDENATPWFVLVDGDVSIVGADLSPLEFDRLPWFEVTRPTQQADDQAVIVVTGEPGAEFTLTSS